MRAIVTGGAGFIGSHLVDSLLRDGWQVVVIDNFDPFYDRGIKENNIAQHLNNPNFTLLEEDICNISPLQFALTGKFDVIVHLAAKAGVRNSIKDPVSYQKVNVLGTQNMLELARILSVKQFVFASSSSVYGVNPNVPWTEDEQVLMPISPYAATKVAGELLGHVYSKLYGIRFIALRFFTVYGPRQRPDLAIHKFCRLIMEGQPIPMYGDGSSCRDYTYIDDIIFGVRKAMEYEKTDYEIINLGNNRTVSLKELVTAIENALQLKASIDYYPPQPGDVPRTFANIDKANRLLGYSPRTSLPEGLAEFAGWLKGV